MLKTWCLAGRSWSLPAALVPVTLGAVLAWDRGYFQPLLLILSLIAGAAIQLGSNYTNTYCDYISGMDTYESNKTNPQLLLGILKPGPMCSG